MDAELMEKARAGLQAWQDGNLAGLEELLDPDVELLWWEPGEWDCHGRDDVMDTLRERYEQGFGAGELEFVDGGAHSIVVVAHPSAVGGPDWPEEVATVIEFRRDKVTRMQDYRTREEALAAAAEF